MKKSAIIDKDFIDLCILSGLRKLEFVVKGGLKEGCEWSDFIHYSLSFHIESEDYIKQLYYEYVYGIYSYLKFDDYVLKVVVGRYLDIYNFRKRKNEKK